VCSIASQRGGKNDEVDIAGARGTPTIIPIRQYYHRDDSYEASAGTSNIDFVVFPPRWLAMEHTFRAALVSRAMSQLNSWACICGVYDAKERGFVPGGSSLHNCMSGHGPDAATFDKATAADTSIPVHIADTMAFMFESRSVLKPTSAALQGTPRLQADYLSHWLGLKKTLRPRQAVTIPSPDSTNDSKTRSWLPSANQSGLRRFRFKIFPSACCPACPVPRRASRRTVALGDQIIDLRALAERAIVHG